MNELDAEDKVNLIIEKNKWYNFEGSTGVNRLEAFAEILGYGDRYNQSAIEAMLEDNSGMIDSIVEFIHENATCYEDKLDEYIEECCLDEEETE